jgi:SAM-dependent methyltransferase
MTDSANDFTANIERFSGFADIYDQHRPGPPGALADSVLHFAGLGRPRLVVDLGSGTGLATRYWAAHADAVVGIEPSADMRHQAELATPLSKVTYREGFSHDTGLDDRCTQVVAVSQALHWMEPEGTFREVARILEPGGVFAACDYDWPPMTGAWEADAAFQVCVAHNHEVYGREQAGRPHHNAPTGEEQAAGPHHNAPTGEEEAGRPHHNAPTGEEQAGRPHHNAPTGEEQAGRPRHNADPGPITSDPPALRRWEKSRHLERMAASGVFRYTREFLLHYADEGDAERLVGLALSQGGLQTLRKQGVSDDDLGLTSLRAVANRVLGQNKRRWLWSARVRVGIV